VRSLFHLENRTYSKKIKKQNPVAGNPKERSRNETKTGGKNEIHYETVHKERICDEN
jgi:hypothetical protein